MKCDFNFDTNTAPYEQTIVFEAWSQVIFDRRHLGETKVKKYISWLKMQVCFLFQTRNKRKFLTKTAFERKFKQIKIGPMICKQSWYT